MAMYYRVALIFLMDMAWAKLLLKDFWISVSRINICQFQAQPSHAQKTSHVRQLSSVKLQQDE